jgi:ABC-type sugar transport system substrate-binding protein
LLNHRRRATTFAAVALIGLSLVLAGCGGDDDDAASDTESVATETNGGGAGTGGATASIPEGYSGVEADLPTAYDEPTMQSGTRCKIGFQNPVAANEFLGFVQRAVIAKAKSFGCTVIALDDALNPDKQVSNMQQLLGQNVDAIIFYPLDPKATTPVLQRAKNQDVPVIAIDASFGDTKAVPLIATQVWQGRDIQAYLQAKVLAEEKSDAKVGLIGIGIPVPAIKYLTGRQKHFAEEEGLTVLATQDNPSDDVTGGEKAANALLQRNQEVDSVIGYNDPSALGAVIAARATGRDITVVGLNGSSDGIEGVKSERLIATVQVDPIGIGAQTATAAYSLITEQNLPLPPIVIRPGVLVTQENVDDIPSWSDQLAEIQ